MIGVKNLEGVMTRFVVAVIVGGRAADGKRVAVGFNNGGGDTCDRAVAVSSTSNSGVGETQAVRREIKNKKLNFIYRQTDAVLKTASVYLDYFPFALFIVAQACFTASAGAVFNSNTRTNISLNGDQ